MGIMIIFKMKRSVDIRSVHIDIVVVGQVLRRERVILALGLLGLDPQIDLAVDLSRNLQNLLAGN